MACPGWLRDARTSEQVQRDYAIVQEGHGSGRATGRTNHPYQPLLRAAIFDSMEVGLNDAPKANEMVVILVMSTVPRIHNRAGGLAGNNIKGKDGLR